MIQVIFAIALFVAIFVLIAYIIQSQINESRRYKKIIFFLEFIEDYASSSNRNLGAKALEKKEKLLVRMTQVANEIMDRGYSLKQIDTAISTMIEKTKD